EQLLRQSLVGEALADIGLLVGRAGNERTAAIEQEHRRAGMLCRRCRKLADPMQIYDRQDDATDIAVVGYDGNGGNQARRLIEMTYQVPAKREFARIQRILKMRTIGNVQPDRQAL